MTWFSQESRWSYSEPCGCRRRSYNRSKQLACIVQSKDQAVSTRMYRFGVGPVATSVSSSGGAHSAEHI